MPGGTRIILCKILWYLEVLGLRFPKYINFLFVKFLILTEDVNCFLPNEDNIDAGICINQNSSYGFRKLVLTFLL